jgi:hypothetical protein
MKKSNKIAIGIIIGTVIAAGVIICFAVIRAVLGIIGYVTPMGVSGGRTF